MAEPRSLDDFAALFDDAGWVRRLAARLVGEGGRADDLVQEAALVTLRGGGPGPRDARAWMGGVLRNLARREARGRSRRDRREAGAARPERVRSTSDLLEQAELQRLVLEAVTKLDEPYRGTLLLHFYESLSLEELAGRQGVPASTARTRLQRGLETLRERFDREHGGRAAWCALVSPLLSKGPSLTVPPSVAASASSGAVSGPQALLGVLTMNGVMKVTAVLAVALTGLLGFWFWPDVTPGPAAAAVSQEERAPAIAAGAPAQVESTMEAVVDAERSPLEAASPYEPQPGDSEVTTTRAPARLDGRVVDELGRGVAGARVVLGGDESRQDAESDGSGHFAFEDAACGVLRVEVSGPGLEHKFLDTRLQPGEEVHLGEIMLVGAGTVIGAVRDASGRPIAGARVFATGVGSLRVGEELRRKGPILAGGVPETRTDEQGAFRLEGIAAGLACIWGHAQGHSYERSAPLEFRVGVAPLELELTLEALQEEDRITGSVLDPSGEPVAGAQVEYSFSFANTSKSASIATEVDGSFELVLDHTVPHDFLIEDRAGRWTPIVHDAVEPGATGLVFGFDEPRWVELQTRDGDGQPVEQFALRAFETVQRAIGRNPLEGVDLDLHEAGRARLRTPSVAFELQVDAPGFELARLGPYDPASSPTSIVAELIALPGVRGRVVAGGRPVAGASVRLCRPIGPTRTYIADGFRLRYNANSGEQIETGSDGSFRLYPRQAGEYLLRVEHEPYADAELELRIDDSLAREGVELELDSGGAIEGRVIPLRGREVEGTVIGLSHGDGRAFTHRVGADGSFRFDKLCVGGWQVEVRDVEVGVMRTSTSSSSSSAVPPIEWTCFVEAGETSYVELDLRGDEPARVVGRLVLGEALALGWTATLRAADAPLGEVDAVPLSGDGRFELEAPGPGVHQLNLRAPSAEAGTLGFSVGLELVTGTNEWRGTLELGGLRAEGVDDERAAAPLRYVWLGTLASSSGRVSGVQVDLRPDGSGGFVLPFVPAGPGQVQRLEPAADGGPGSWRVVAEFEVRPGEVAQVELR